MQFVFHVLLFVWTVPVFTGRFESLQYLGIRFIYITALVNCVRQQYCGLV